MANKGGHIQKLTVEGFMKIKHAVVITHGSRVIKVAGRNAQGKTALLNAIAFALGGAKELPEVPVNTGSDSALVVAEFEDMTIKRGITADGVPSLQLIGPGGARFPRPQSILDRQTSKRIFDPAEFIRLDPAKRLELLRAVVNLDFSELDAQRAEVYENRRVLNADIQRMEHEIEAMPGFPEAPKEPVSTADIDAQIAAADPTNRKREELLKEAQAIESSYNEKAQLLESLRNERKGYEEQIAEMHRKIAELQLQIATVTARMNKGDPIVASLKTKAQEARQRWESAPRIDVAPLIAQKENVQATNAKVHANTLKADARAALKKKTERADEMTSWLVDIDKRKQKAIEEAKFPVRGLSFSDKTVLIDGLPFEQASQMQQRRVSIAIAIALDPAFRVMLLRDASLLDEDAIKDFEQLANEFDIQLWLELVSKDAPGAVIIEDGRVKGAS